MEFNSSNHVHRCIPTVLGIRAKYDQYLADKANGEKAEEVKPVIIGLRFISLVDVDSDTIAETSVRYEKTPEEAQRIIAGFTKDRIKKNVSFIENLVIDGKEVTDFDIFYEVAPPELVAWVCKAVYSSFILSEAELKN